MTVKPSVDKVEVDIPKQNDKPARRPVKYAEMYILQRPRGNQRNWNNLKSHQLGNISYLTDFNEFDGGYVAFGGELNVVRLLAKETIGTGKIDFEDVYFVKELQFNLFSVSQMCDKKNSVLFTNTECFILSHDFELADESHALLRVPRKNNMYSVDIKNIVPKKDLTCLVAKATFDESMLWLRRLGHINFKNINKLVKDNLVRGLPSKCDGPKWLFDIDTITESMNYVPVIAESEIDNQERPNAENSTKNVNTVRPSINTASSNINTPSPTVNTVRQSDDFFGTDNGISSLDGVAMDIRNISATYHVPTTPNTRINKYHSFDNVIGDIQSGVQTRRMTITTDEQGFISAIYKEKTHEDLHTYVPRGKRAIGIKWVFRNKKDERGIVIRNKARLVSQGCTQEEGIDYDKFFAPVARIEAIRLFFAYASFMRFLVYQMNVKSAFLLQVKQKSDGIFISQDKYVDEILRKFKYDDVKPATIVMDKEKALLKDSNGDDVDVHLYRSMIGSLMYLTSSIPDIMFVVCTCAKFYVTPKVSHLHAVKGSLDT
uniref:Ribonuclease H-like domain-containing protein n=1 Tax=Tanacetum cinerariifolium TaxID=118510 RepID=A0A699IA51_TANCI|nr:ribonuclease H-like domain-containing protein [Tanacetum cinerariifolium]